MKKLIAVAILELATFLVSDRQLLAAELISSASLNVEEPDKRTEQLREFLEFYDSPLAAYASVFIKASDKYNLDWKLVPSITGVESTFGKAIPSGSYNAYGWANGAYYFSSWEESIEIVSKTLRERYIDRGADTVDKIAVIYAPPSKTWAWKVKYFMEKLETFAPTDILTLELTL